MNKVNLKRRSIGLNFNHDTSARVQIWAPKARQVILQVSGKLDLPLEKQERGYWGLKTEAISPGMSYQILLDGQPFPDIASLRQPDIHGPSVAFAPADYAWTDNNWHNPPLEDYIVYELHTGTFAPQGNFRGITDKLTYLKSLGITAIELMPVAAFPGERNWGYDGVFPFAVQESYGGPAELQRLVNTCHEHGLAVILDVVYNHLGPEGNYLDAYGPYFTGKYKTPWGNAINFDDAGSDSVRYYFIENALMWLRDFHIDALRLDAVHAIRDFSPKHILREIKEYTDQLMAETGRQHYLIIECDLNDPRFINATDQAGYGMDAQWTDEFHHALRVSAGGEKDGYYSDFNGIQDLVTAYNHGYVYFNRYSTQRDKTFGVDPAGNEGKQFVVFSQNHDQVGNRMLGERSGALFSFEMQKLMAAAVLVSPFLPMLFMGEEYGETNPFLYFVSHTDPDLIEAVRKGRSEEFAAFHAAGEAPDPQAADTFKNSCLQWQLIDEPQHNVLFRYYQQLIAIRKSEPALRLPDRCRSNTFAGEATGTLTLLRSHESQTIACLMNFSKQPQEMPVPEQLTRHVVLFDSADLQWNGPGASSFTGSFTLRPESILIIKQDV